MATAVRDRALKGRTHFIDADAPVNGVADPATDMWAAGKLPVDLSVLPGPAVPM